MRARVRLRWIELSELDYQRSEIAFHPFAAMAIEVNRRYLFRVPPHLQLD